MTSVLTGLFIQKHSSILGFSGQSEGAGGSVDYFVVADFRQDPVWILCALYVDQ